MKTNNENIGLESRITNKNDHNETWQGNRYKGLEIRITKFTCLFSYFFILHHIYLRNVHLHQLTISRPSWGSQIRQDLLCSLFVFFYSFNGFCHRTAVLLEFLSILFLLRGWKLIYDSSWVIIVDYMSRLIFMLWSGDNIFF